MIAQQSPADRNRRSTIRTQRLAIRHALSAVVLLAGTALCGGNALAQGAGGGMPVEAVKARAEPFAETIMVAGTLEAVQSIDVASEVAGRLSAISVKDGARVSEGDVLFKLDDAIARAELAEARASIELNRRNAERARDLAGRGAGTGRALDEAVAALQLSQAQVASAQVRLDKTTITAPFSGVAGFRTVDLGAYISAGQTLTTLDRLDPIRVSFRLPERFAGVVKPGETVIVEVDAFPAERFTATITAIDPRLDAGGRSLAIHAEIPNPDTRLKPGMFARISAVLNEIGNAVIIPEQAIVPDRNGPFVYKIVDGKAVPQPVTIGARRVGEVGVTEGLENGDLVISAGQIKIGPGMPVTPLPGGSDPFARQDAAPAGGATPAAPADDGATPAGGNAAAGG